MTDGRLEGEGALPAETLEDSYCCVLMGATAKLSGGTGDGVGSLERSRRGKCSYGPCT
jgi:hypothetical protein